MNTKGYAVLLAAIVVIGIAFIGIILFHDPVLIKQRPEEVYLNLDSMKEASDSVVSADHGPEVDKIFPANHQNTKNDSIPWADAYLCRSFSTADSLSGDTLILVLNTKTDKGLDKIENPDEYWTGLKSTPKFKRCRIMVSPEELVCVKKVRYKFAGVELITDDY